MEKVTVYLEPQQFRAVRALAKARGCTVTDLVREAIDLVLAYPDAATRRRKADEHALLEHLRRLIADPAVVMTSFGRSVLVELPADLPADLVSGPLLPPPPEDGPPKMIATKFYPAEIATLEQLAARLGITKVAVIRKGLALFAEHVAAREIEAVEHGPETEPAQENGEPGLTPDSAVVTSTPMSTTSPTDKAKLSTFRLYPEEIAEIERVARQLGTSKTTVIRQGVRLLAQQLGGVQVG